MPEADPPTPVVERAEGRAGLAPALGGLAGAAPRARICARRRLAHLLRPRPADRDRLRERRRRRGRPDHAALPRRQRRRRREDRASPPTCSEVVVTARIDKDVAHFLDADAEFWVVRPSVTAQGVTGIETVISGVYIEAFWDDEVGEPRDPLRGPAAPAADPRRPAGPARPAARRRRRLDDDRRAGALQAHPGRQDRGHRADRGRRRDDRRLRQRAQRRAADRGHAVLERQRLLDRARRRRRLAQRREPGLAAAGRHRLRQRRLRRRRRVETGHVFELYPSETAARQNLLRGRARRSG